MLQEKTWQEPVAPQFVPRAGEDVTLTKYLHLVKRAVSHLRSQVLPSFSWDDLEQVGTMGLLEAIRRYGDEPDEYFESYAFKRIRGAILDELRRQDWRPRQVRQQSHELNHAWRKLNNSLGRAPNEAELCEALDVSKEKVQEMLYASQAEEMQSLDELLQAGLHEPKNSHGMAGTDLKLSMKKALSSLPKREQLLLTLYYQNEMT